MTWLRGLLAKLFSKTPFWWTWPSWVTEVVSGVALQLGLWIWNPHAPWWLALPVGLGLSAFYEWGLDRNGWRWQDVAQRAIGQAAFAGVLITL